MQVFYYRERRAAGPTPPVDMKSPTVMDVLNKSIATIAGVSGAVALMYGLLYAITHVPSLTTLFQWLKQTASASQNLTQARLAAQIHHRAAGSRW